MSFIKIYRDHATNRVYLEFIPDEYIKTQPINDADYKEKIKEYEKMTEFINAMDGSHYFVVDCDKMIRIDKINFIYIAKATNALFTKYHDQGHLDGIQVIHSSPLIKKIYSGFKRILPQAIIDKFTLE